MVKHRSAERSASSVSPENVSIIFFPPDVAFPITSFTWMGASNGTGGVVLTTWSGQSDVVSLGLTRSVGHPTLGPQSSYHTPLSLGYGEPLVSHLSAKVEDGSW